MLIAIISTIIFIISFYIMLKCSFDKDWLEFLSLIGTVVFGGISLGAVTIVSINYLGYDIYKQEAIAKRSTVEQMIENVNVYNVFDVIDTVNSYNLKEKEIVRYNSTLWLKGLDRLYIQDTIVVPDFTKLTKGTEVEHLERK